MAKTTKINLDSIVEDKDNVREHTERNDDSVKRSVKRFGAARSIVIDKDNVVRAGNKTIEAAKEAGIKKAVVIDVDGEELVVVRRSDWSHTDATAYAIADNRAAEHATWKWEGLTDQMKVLMDEGIDSDDLGWAKFELDPLMEANWTPRDPLPETDALHSIHLTDEQWNTVSRAADKVRTDESDKDIPLGRCVELICGDFLS